jgi:hypothetical protein
MSKFLASIKLTLAFTNTERQPRVDLLHASNSHLPSRLQMHTTPTPPPPTPPPSSPRYTPSQFGWNGKLVGVAGYGDSTCGDHVVLKIDVPGTTEDIFVGFNSMTGINSGTKENGDKVIYKHRDLLSLTVLAHNAQSVYRQRVVLLCFTCSTPCTCLLFFPTVCAYAHVLTFTRHALLCRRLHSYKIRKPLTLTPFTHSPPLPQPRTHQIAQSPASWPTQIHKSLNSQTHIQLQFKRTRR